MFSLKFKYSSLILLLAVVVMFYSTALPFSAVVEPTEQYVPVTIDKDELVYLLSTYNNSSLFVFIFDTADGVLYSSDSLNGTVFEDSSFQNFYTGVSRVTPDDVYNHVLIFPNVDTIEAFTVEEFNSLTMGVQFKLPFDFVLGSQTTFSFGFYFQNGDFNSQSVVTINDITNDVVYFSKESTLSNTKILLDDILMDKYLLDSVSPFVLETRDYCVHAGVVTNFVDSTDEYLKPEDFTGTNNSGCYLSFTHIIEHSSSYDTNIDVSQIWTPAFIIRPFTIYVLEEIYPVVEDYLAAITNPSPESAAEVERLEQELEEISEQLRQDASDLEVEKPDISDSVENLPSDVIEGMGEASETVLSPLMTIDLIATLFSVLFGVVALKLILFGSGTA